MYKNKVHLVESTLYVFVTQEHFTIAGAIVIDNFGAGLTPEQIRERMQEYDLLACNLQTPIVLLTTSCIAINFMKDAEEFLYVFKNGNLENPQTESKWVPVMELYSQDFLAHFYPGDLYDRGYFDGYAKEDVW